MHIRIATPDDINTLATIVKKNYDEEAATMAYNEIQDMFKDITIKNTYVLAEENATILGFAGYAQSVIDWQAYCIFRVNVAPEHQHQGVATAILTDVIARIKNKKGIDEARFILLTAIQTTLYQRLGFKIVHSYLGEQNKINHLMLLDLSI